MTERKTDLERSVTDAAVIVPLVLESSATQSTGLYLNCAKGRIIPISTKILFTLRAQEVEHHKGQISFPGGAYEPKDTGLLQTALRECQEEIGLSEEKIVILGELPSTPTVTSGFNIKPFIGLVHEPLRLSINPKEIQEVLLVPLDHLLDPKNSVIEHYKYQGIYYKLKAYFFGPHRIWGATARILQELLENYLRPFKAEEKNE